MSSTPLPGGRDATPPSGTATLAQVSQPLPELAAAAGPPVVPRLDATPVTFQSDRAEIGPIAWATAIDPTTKAPHGVVPSFAADDRRLYAVMKVIRLSKGTSIAATWSYNGAPLDGFLRTIKADRDLRGAWLEFHIDLGDADAWPAGIYAIAVTVDGHPAQQGAVFGQRSDQQLTAGSPARIGFSLARERLAVLRSIQTRERQITAPQQPHTWAERYPYLVVHGSRNAH